MGRMQFLFADQQEKGVVHPGEGVALPQAVTKRQTIKPTR